MLQSRLKKARKDSGLSQVDLACTLNVAQSTVANWEAGKRTPDLDMIEEIAKCLNVSPAWLAGYTDDPINYNDPDLIAGLPQEIIRHFNGDIKKAYKAEQAINDDRAKEVYPISQNREFLLKDESSNIAAVINSDNIYRIPVFESVSAGFGAYASDEIMDYIPVMIKNPYDVDDTIAIKVKGDSMYPKIEDGDIIIVRKQTSVDSGDIAVLLMDGDEGLVKKVEYGSDWIELHSINPEYKTKRFEGREVLRLQVVGLVIGSYKTF